MQEIRSLSQFNKLKAGPLLIVDFYATWCGPCKAISPVIERLAKQHESSGFIVFAKADVDKAKDVAQECGISAMPTFQFFKNGAKIDEVRGADVQQLTTKIGYYTSAAIKDQGAQGEKVGQSKGASSTPKATTTGSLRSLIDIESSLLKNATLLSNVRNIASPPPAGYALASASGAQLLVHLRFSEAVTPTFLEITVPKGSESSAPARIHIGTNVAVKVSKDKDGVESNDLEMESLAKAEKSQSFNVFSDEYVNGKAKLKMKASVFTAVRSLTIRVDANMSGEASTITKLGELDIIGSKA